MPKIVGFIERPEKRRGYVRERVLGKIGGKLKKRMLTVKQA